MIWLSLILIVFFKLLLAGKDATSYLLKSKSSDDLTETRIKRWHRDGVAIDILFTLILTWATGLWIISPIQSVIVRLGVFDIAFNKWAGLDSRHLGSTAWFDKLFIRIFGEKGALKKSLFSLFLIISLHLLYYILK